MTQTAVYGADDSCHEWLLFFSSNLNSTFLAEEGIPFYKETNKKLVQRGHDFPTFTQPECMKLESELRSAYKSAPQEAQFVGVSMVVWRTSRDHPPYHGGLTRRQLHAAGIWVWL